MQFRKLWLNINGANRMVVFDPEKDSLADVLRRLGLTGTKIGCGIGVCGVCSVLVDGKVVRSCTKKMKTVPEFAKITTIEGVGTANHLHPLQQAFITYGAVQCGFCIPGFIVSAYQLLQENPDPTREEVRAWFKKNRNYCRCTGYKQIVDAVMAAAKVMRGEATMEEITYHHPEGDRYYNSHLPRPSALGKVTGTVDYGEDASLKMPEGTLHLAVVQPRVTHHARIKSIDISQAEKMPGVKKVILGKDIRAYGGNNLLNQYVAHPRAKIDRPTRPIICEDKIVHWGDVIGLVVADTREHARAAAKYVKMDYEELPAVMSVPEALAPGAAEVHDGFPNQYISQPVYRGAEDIDEVIENSAYSVSGSFHTSRQPHLSMEGDIVIAYRDEQDRLTIQSKSQGIYPNLMTIGKGIGIDNDHLRVLQHGAVGASFGWSIDAVPLSLAGAACLIMDAPVSLVMSWEEHQHHDGKRSSLFSNSTLACDAEGHLTAVKYDLGVDHGCYVEGGDSIMPKYMKYGNPYVIPNVRGIVRMVSTNHDHTTAWRGYGVPQNATSVEALMDMLAEKVGMDPFEFRYINIMDGDDRSVNGERYEGLQYKRIMDMARPEYYQWKKEAEAASTAEVRHGVGAVPMFFIPLGSPRDRAEARIELKADNKFYIYETYHDMGQGGDIGTLAAALEALRPMGVTPDDIVLDINDSDDCPNSGISAGSRSHFMNGSALRVTGQMVVDALRKEDGTFRTYEEQVAIGGQTDFKGLFTIANEGYSGLSYNDGTGDSEPKPMMGLCLAEVGVEAATGKPHVLRIKAWADCGVIANYMSAEGQAYGGFAQNIGYALFENYEDVKKHGNIIGAGLPPIDEVPDDMEVAWVEDNPCRVGPFGSNGLSEIFFGGEHTAFLQAIYNATGVRVYDIPADPKKIKAGMDAIAAGEEPEAQREYFFGTDFEDEFDDLLAHPVATDWMQKMIAGIAKREAEEKAAEEAKKAEESVSVADLADAGIVEL